MSSYTYKKKDVRSFIVEIYAKGLQPSQYLSGDEIEVLIESIGIFKFKGYLYAFKSDFTSHNLDEVFVLYFFDKYLTQYLMDLTFGVEAKLKSSLVELCYQKTTNPFFYLARRYHKNSQFYINKETLKNWKNLPITQNVSGAQEVYKHYGMYYRQKYDFNSNQARYLGQETLITLTNDVNYPPFHYLIESATLGVLIYFIKSLKINNFDILNSIASSFGVNQSGHFDSFLERLNEIRNRAAHRGRLFNRSYRSVTGFGKFNTLRSSVSNHRVIDVILFLLFLLNKLDIYQSYNDFEHDVIERLFVTFQTDYDVGRDSFGLLNKLSNAEFGAIRGFMLRAMK